MPAQWASVWEDFRRDHHDQAKATIANRQAVVNRLAHWLATDAGGNITAITAAEQVTKTDLKRYVNACTDALTGSGVLSVYAGLKVFWRWYSGEYRDCEDCADPRSNRYHACALNPMTGVARPLPAKHRAKTVPVLTAEQIDAILAAVSSRSDAVQVRDRALILLLLETGLRRNEARMLDLSDVAMSGRDGGGTAVVRHAKNGRPRVTTFGPDTALALRRWERKRPATGDPALFTTMAGERLSYQAHGAIVDRLGQAAGIDGLHPHMFRHAWTDAHYREGTSEAVMRKLGGWVGSIPQTYGEGAAEERAVNMGLSRPVLGLIRGRAS
jgi:integrase